MGFDAESDQLEADKLRQYVYGGHVADYMRYLQEEDEEKYKAHFSRFIKEGITADTVSKCGIIRIVVQYLQIVIEYHFMQ